MTHDIVAKFVRTPLNLPQIAGALKAEFQLVEQERNLLQFRLGDEGFMHVFGYGVVTFFGIPEEHIVTLVERIRAIDPEGEDDESIDPERYSVIIDTTQPEAVDFEFIRITDRDPEKIRLISEALSQSMMLDLLEKRVDITLGRFERLHASLARSGRLATRAKNVMRMIGKNSSIMHFIVTKLSFLDKPDITWEEKEYELLFTRLRKEFELDERFRALKFRLEFIQDSSELALDMLATRRGEALEIIIILLIAFEILFFLLNP